MARLRAKYGEEVIRTWSKAKIGRMLAKQALEDAAKRRSKMFETRARDALKKFRPRKSERGKLIMVSTGGKRDTSKRGYLVYITKSGKKQLVKQGRDPLRARKIARLQVPNRLHKAGQQFHKTRLKLIETGKKKLRPIVRGEGEIIGEKSLINDLTAAIARTLSKQESHRTFLITILMRVQLPGGHVEVIKAVSDIARADHVAIDRAGVRQFVRRKLWAVLALELGVHGYVSQESYNHIRKAKRNEGKNMLDWTTNRGEPWRGADRTKVKITHVEWKIEQLTK